MPIPGKIRNGLCRNHFPFTKQYLRGRPSLPQWGWPPTDDETPLIPPPNKNFSIKLPVHGFAPRGEPRRGGEHPWSPLEQNSGSHLRFSTEPRNGFLEKIVNSCILQNFLNNRTIPGFLPKSSLKKHTISLPENNARVRLFYKVMCLAGHILRIHFIVY